jgi:hypothetical protein
MHTWLNASAVTRTAHFATAGLFVATREISPTSFDYAADDVPRVGDS